MEEPMMRTVITGLMLATLSPLTAMANEIDETLDVEPGGTLRIDLERGAVEVSSHDANQVRIEARASGWAGWNFDFDVSRQGNDVHLVGESFGWGYWLFWPFGGPRVHVRAWVPREYSVAARTKGGGVDLASLSGRISAETSGGAVEVKDATGPVDVRTSGGPVRIEQVNGNLEAETSGGSIDVAAVSGDVRAHTSGGSIEVVRVDGQVDVRTSGGPIDIREAAGQVEAATSGGGIQVSFTDAPAGTLSTSGGRIEVRFPQTAGANLDAETSGGRVDVAHPLTLHGNADPHHVVGAINGGGAPLRLRTSGGSIYVRPL
jgi:hypothetical protein